MLMSTIAGADQVLVLDRGRLVEQGTHTKLMQIPGGLYRSYLEHQTAPADRPAAAGVRGAAR